MLEKFADLLDVTVANIIEAGHFAELGNETLYTNLYVNRIPQVAI